MKGSLKICLFYLCQFVKNCKTGFTSMNKMLKLPRVIAGTSLLGNLYKELSFDQKKEIVKAYIDANGLPAVFDSAGKYGAGLALETLGACLRELKINAKDIIISNKLAWMRMPLTGQEPTFEPGIWKNLHYDASQNISPDGIIECFEQGNALLKTYTAQLVSVHDPDEYLSAAVNEADADKRYADILGAYRALFTLKQKGLVKAVGIGAKTWQVIERINNDVPLDWVMLANSLTIYHHPPQLLSFVNRLYKDGVTIINSAVFHGGFLVGSNYFNYRQVSADNEKHVALLQWREKFFALCSRYKIKPAAACIYFAINIPGIASIALNSSSTERTRQNIGMANTKLPASFWQEMKAHGLISSDYPYL
jgi:D-threo-aldose 1-dehydrogenase